MTGREAYEADLQKRPTYPDGSPRKSWEQLDDLARWSWSREPKQEDAPMTAETIDTGDYVHHAPTGHDLVVAYVKGDRFAWCGWPPGEGRVSDITLTRKATDEEREKLLRELAAVKGSDPRWMYARERLQNEYK